MICPACSSTECYHLYGDWHVCDQCGLEFAARREIWREPEWLPPIALIATDDLVEENDVDIE